MEECPIEDIVHDGAGLNFLLSGSLGEFIVFDPLVEVILPIFEELFLVGESFEESHTDGFHSGVEADRLSFIGSKLFIDFPTFPFLEFREFFLEDFPDILIDGDEEVRAIIVLKGTSVDT